MNTSAANIGQFGQPRGPDELDLVLEVRNLLLGSGLQQQAMLYFDTNHFVQEAISKKPEVQRFLLNRYWNLQLMNCTASSINVRFSLIPDGQVQDWLRLFATEVMPFIVKNGLPKELAHG